MNHLLRHSLPTRAWAAVIMIASLAIGSAIGSGMLAWIAEGDAKAINIAGSIRMATYRINHQLATDFVHQPLPSRQLLSSNNTVFNTAGLSQSNTHEYPSQLGKKQPVIALLVSDMQQRIDQLQHYQSLPSNHDPHMERAFATIQQQWAQQLKPLLLAEDTDGFYSASLSYIVSVDNYVHDLQLRNEKRQSWQQTLQVVSLLITIIIMLAGMYELQQNVLHPVQQLIRANTRFKRGEANTQVNIAGYEEFNQLGDSFNDMAQTISAYQQSLQTEVRIKTEHLTQANQALSVLYEFAQQLATTPVTLHRLDNLIEQFASIMPELKLTLCIENELLNNKDAIALHSGDMQELCSKLNCEQCHIKHDRHTRSYPIMQHNNNFGELRVQPVSVLADSPVTFLHSRTQQPDSHSGNPSDNPVDNKHTIITANDEMLMTLANLIGTALSLRKQRQQEHQLILMEERTTIARELHDSLAQSLSYLKIQVRMLEKRLQSQPLTDSQTSPEISVNTSSTDPAVDSQQQVQAEHIDAVIDEIKTALNSAYQQLRELLVTFRLKIDNDSFDDALHEAVAEFAQKAGFTAQLNNRVMTLNLSANEQIDLLQIAREALSNIHRHAYANQVDIDLAYTGNTRHITLTITDNGVGIDDDFDQSQHHGLMIMQERAHNLGGSIDFLNNTPTGTIVRVSFLPKFFANHLTATY